MIMDKFITKGNGLNGAIAGGILGGAGALATDLYRGSGYTKSPMQNLPQDDNDDDVFIVVTGGNGGDWQSDKNPDKQYMDKLLGKDNYSIFGFDELDLALPYINDLPKNKRVHIVGHSLGGSSAYRLSQVAGLLNRKIDTLVTLDSVGKNVGLTEPGRKPFNVENWYNYYPKDFHANQKSDYVALAGGRYEDAEGARNRGLHKLDHVSIREAAKDAYRKEYNKRLKNGQ